jgi:hypothetical protein
MASDWPENAGFGKGLRLRAAFAKIPFLHDFS